MLATVAIQAARNSRGGSGGSMLLAWDLQRQQGHVGFVEQAVSEVSNVMVRRVIVGRIVRQNCQKRRGKAIGNPMSMGKKIAWLREARMPPLSHARQTRMSAPPK